MPILWKGIKMLCEECQQLVKDKVDIRARAVLCSDCVQSHINFINMLERTAYVDIKRRNIYMFAYNEWNRLGKIETTSPQRAMALKKGIKRCAKADIYPKINRQEFPVSWNDLLEE